MKTGQCTLIDGYCGGQAICFHAEVSGRSVGVAVSEEIIKRIAEALKYTDHVGHAGWHAQNPDSPMPCSTCTRQTLASESGEKHKLTPAQIADWLDENTTFFDVEKDKLPTDTLAPNVPVLAGCSKRIWYHATDDQEQGPFSHVLARALSRTLPSATRRKLSELVPTNWLDPLLTGPKAVINGGHEYGGKDIENLLRAIKARIEEAEATNG